MILQLFDYFPLVPIIFLLFFILTTSFFLKNISKWFALFFEESNYSETENFAIDSQSSEIQSFTSRLRKIMRKAPRTLLRISSSFYQPTEGPLPKREKPLSVNFSKGEEHAKHKRIFSDPILIHNSEVLSPNGKQGLKKFCIMCFENFCNAVIMECGHGGICFNCSIEVWKSTGSCHMCRGEITQVLQIEVSSGQVVKVSRVARVVRQVNS